MRGFGGRGLRGSIVAGVCGACVLGLGAAALFAGLDTGDQVASLVGAGAGVVALAVSLRTPGSDPGGDGSGPPARRWGIRWGIHARGRGAVAAGRDATGNATGAGSSVQPPPTEET